MEFCYYANFGLAYTVFNVPFTVEDRFLHKRFPLIATALFCVLNGPVGGSVFFVGADLVFHHPDAFSSFWLHVIPMWLSYALRWRYYPLLLKHNFPKLSESQILDGTWHLRDTIWYAFQYCYAPWAIMNVVFLTAHPFTPLAKYETMFDLFVHGGLPETRDDEFLSRMAHVLGFVSVHCILSFQGFLAAAICFRYQRSDCSDLTLQVTLNATYTTVTRCHIVWICCVFISTMSGGFKFYEEAIQSSGEADVTANLLMGVKKCAISWMLVLAALFYSTQFPEKASIAKSDIKRRRDSSKQEFLKSE